jgi:hypothetical protein
MKFESCKYAPPPSRDEDDCSGDSRVTACWSVSLVARVLLPLGRRDEVKALLFERCRNRPEALYHYGRNSFDAFRLKQKGRDPCRRRSQVPLNLRCGRRFGCMQIRGGDPALIAAETPSEYTAELS